jgi:hypothetical protein
MEGESSLGTFNLELLTIVRRRRGHLLAHMMMMI